MNALSFLINRRALSGAVLLVLLAMAVIAGWTISPHAFFRGYWFGLMFWMQLSIGALIILLIQYLSGGRWGEAAAPMLRLIAGGIFLLAVLFLPPLFALPHIFSWTQIRPGLSAEVLANKQVWLNQSFFIGRTIFYLAVFAVIAVLWRRRAVPVAASGPALVFTILLISFAPADWMMSLQPTFYSSLYPFMYFADAMVIAFATLTGTTAWLQLRGIRPADPRLLHDYGKLLFAAVLFWGYIAFAQFIIIWTGNLPDEAAWYVARSERGWMPWTAFVILAYWAVPFCLLLSIQVKRDPRRILRICVALFVLHWVELFWMMRPELGRSLAISPFDVVMPLLLGACWLWFVLRPAGLRAVASTEVSHE